MFANCLRDPGFWACVASLILLAVAFAMTVLPEIRRSR